MTPAPPPRASGPRWGGRAVRPLQGHRAARPLSWLEEPQLSHTGILDPWLQQGGQTQGRSVFVSLACPCLRHSSPELGDACAPSARASAVQAATPRPPKRKAPAGPGLRPPAPWAVGSRPRASSVHSPRASLAPRTPWRLRRRPPALVIPTPGLPCVPCPHPPESGNWLAPLPSSRAAPRHCLQAPLPLPDPCSDPAVLSPALCRSLHVC